MLKMIVCLMLAVVANALPTEAVEGDMNPTGRGTTFAPLGGSSSTGIEPPAGITERYCPTHSFTQRSGDKNCIGYVGNKCEAGGKKFVDDYITSCHGSAACWGACPTIAAIAWQESGWATKAKSWDWGGCGGVSTATGAFGVLQFDLSSNLDPFPWRWDAQLKELESFSDSYTSFTKWASCTNINPAGSGWVPAMQEVYDTAKSWCQESMGRGTYTFPPAQHYGCGVDHHDCPGGGNPTCVVNGVPNKCGTGTNAQVGQQCWGSGRAQGVCTCPNTPSCPGGAEPTCLVNGGPEKCGPNTNAQIGQQCWGSGRAQGVCTCP